MPTYEVGFAALKNLITIAASGQSSAYKPTMSILQFIETYSPATDGNDPVSYAQEVAGKLGVDYQSWPISNLL